MIGTFSVILNSFVSICVAKPFDPKVIIFSRIELKTTLKYIFNKCFSAMIVSQLINVSNYWLLELISTSFDWVVESDAAYQEHLNSLYAYVLGMTSVYVTLVIMKSYFKVALGFSKEAFLMAENGLNFIQSPVISISALIDGFIGMMELFVGGNTLIIIGITLFHTFYATRAVFLTEAGQFNDLAMYCFCCVNMIICMFILQFLVLRYMGNRTKIPRYFRITCITFWVYLVYSL